MHVPVAYTYQYILLLQLIVSSVRLAVDTPFLGVTAHSVRLCPVPWGMSAQRYASTFDQIFKYLMGYAIS